MRAARPGPAEARAHDLPRGVAERGGPARDDEELVGVVLGGRGLSVDVRADVGTAAVAVDGDAEERWRQSERVERSECGRGGRGGSGDVEVEVEEGRRGVVAVSRLKLPLPERGRGVEETMQTM